MGEGKVAHLIDRQITGAPQHPELQVYSTQIPCASLGQVTRAYRL